MSTVNQLLVCDTFMMSFIVLSAQLVLHYFCTVIPRVCGSNNYLSNFNWFKYLYTTLSVQWLTASEVLRMQFVPSLYLLVTVRMILLSSILAISASIDEMAQWSQSTAGNAAVNYRDAAVNIGSSIGVRWLLEIVAFEFEPDHPSIMLTVTLLYNICLIPAVILGMLHQSFKLHCLLVSLTNIYLYISL